MTAMILALILISTTPAPPGPAKPAATRSATAKPAPAKAKATSESQSYYDQARFDDAIALLRDLVARDLLAPEAQLRAHEILARCYVKKGYPALAQDHFMAILRQSPSFRPDPVRVPPDEAAVFEQALRASRADVDPQAAMMAAGAATGARSAEPANEFATRATLEVLARPFASHYVDDTLRASNVVSASLNLAPGVHTVRIVHPSFQAKEWKVRLDAGKVTQLEHDFAATSAGVVRVSSGGIWAEVYVNGKTTGKTTPCILEGLSFGKHEISVARTGFVLENGPQVVTVRPGERPITRFRLRSKTP
jgi:PEGA domain